MMSTFEATRNSILRISDEQTVQLIQEWEKEECLWNTNLPDYPNKEERAYAMEIIAEKLNIPNFGPEHVAMKYKNLRNSYCQELRKMAANDSYRPKVRWFPYMDKYLKPHLQHNKTNGEDGKPLRKKSMTILKTEMISDDEQAWTVEDGTQSTHSDASFSNSVRVEPEVVEETGECSQQSQGTKRKLSQDSNREEKSDKRGSENGESSAKSQANFNVQKYKKRMKQGISETLNLPPLQSGPGKRDYLDYFGDYIASLLRSMPEEKALTLQPAIIELIVNVNLEREDDSD